MRTKVYLTILVAFVTLSLVAQERTNLVTNGDFESTVDVSGNVQASDWNYEVGGVVSTNESNVASDGGLDGSNSLRIRDGIDNDNVVYQDITVTPGRYYAASCLMAFTKDGYTTLELNKAYFNILKKDGTELGTQSIRQKEANAIEGNLTVDNLLTTAPFLVEEDLFSVEISVISPSYPLRADEVKVWMLNNVAELLDAGVGELNTDGSIVTVPEGTLVKDLRGSITVSDFATNEVLDASGGAGVGNRTALTTGNVLVVTSEDGATQKEYRIEIDTSTDISKNIESQLIITNTYIQFPETQSEIRLYDISGKIVKIARNTSVLNIGDCKPGMYVVSGNGVRKLIYKR